MVGIALAGDRAVTPLPPAKAARDNVVPLHPVLPGPAALRSAGLVTRLGLPRDARLVQIAFLGILLSFGVLIRDFTLQPVQMLLTFTAGLITQAVWIATLRLRRKGYLSALVTCFGLSILLRAALLKALSHVQSVVERRTTIPILSNVLLRADSVWVHPLAACLAISAKFALRVHGKHLFNPANLGVVVATTLLPGAWISPGQWGNALAAACWFVVLGGLVTGKAQRSDIAWAFLLSWLGVIALRVAWLGQAWSVWWHQLGSGALLLFAFFMISDPMTIPDDRRARIAYALLVALLAYAWQFVLYRPNALVFALFLATPAVPLLDHLFPSRRFAWHGARPA